MGTKDSNQSYRDAGVDLDAAADAVERYKSAVSKTRIPGVLSDVGGFGGLFALRDAGVDLDDPVLVSATDGVGTKLRLAFELGIHDTIGVDCVAMCVNDIITSGARPLFFLDYLATGRLDPQQAASVVEGIANGCRESGCALIGGETAEMPGFYADGEYDVAGFCVGIVGRSEILDPTRVRNDDVLLGLASTGFHSNGYSLVRKIISDAQLELGSELDGATLGELLLRPTRLYPAALQALRDDEVDLHGVANITGGGFYENIPRALPAEFGAQVDPSTWEVPAVIDLICDAGDVSIAERYSVFNMGIGMVVIVPPAEVERAVATLAEAGYAASAIGQVRQGDSVRIAGIDQ